MNLRSFQDKVYKIAALNKLVHLNPSHRWVPSCRHLNTSAQSSRTISSSLHWKRLLEKIPNSKIDFHYSNFATLPRV